VQKEVTATLTDAITAGLNARNADPSNYVNWITLGQVYEAAVPLKVQGAYQSAQTAYTEAFRRNPKNPGIYLLLAQLEVDNGNLNNAVTYGEQAIQMKPNYLNAYFLLAQIAVADKDLKDAIASIQAASVITPTDPSILFQLGYLQFSAGQYSNAVATLQKSLTLSPQYANAQYYLGLSYEALGDHTDAIAQFVALQKTNPTNATVGEILTALQSGKSIFQSQQATTTQKISKTLPVSENQ
jgi:tetratricopeptide (TPR) repeat protein